MFPLITILLALGISHICEVSRPRLVHPGNGGTRLLDGYQPFSGQDRIKLSPKPTYLPLDDAINLFQARISPVLFPFALRLRLRA